MMGSYEQFFTRATGHEPYPWNLTTFEGSHWEQLRRWARLPLEQVIAALEEMQELSDKLVPARHIREFRQVPAAASSIQQTPHDFSTKTGHAAGRNERHDEQ